jgi:streptomycin 3"-adenylyltransferase
METPARGQLWNDCDADIRAFAERVVEGFRVRLGEELIGVYLHGSLAMGCYRRAKSDLDLLIAGRERDGEAGSGRRAC